MCLSTREVIVNKFNVLSSKFEWKTFKDIYDSVIKMAYDHVMTQIRQTLVSTNSELIDPAAVEINPINEATKPEVSTALSDLMHVEKDHIDEAARSDIIVMLPDLDAFEHIPNNSVLNAKSERINDLTKPDDLRLLNEAPKLENNTINDLSLKVLSISNLAEPIVDKANVNTVKQVNQSIANKLDEANNNQIDLNIAPYEYESKALKDTVKIIEASKLDSDKNAVVRTDKTIKNSVINESAAKFSGKSKQDDSSFQFVKISKKPKLAINKDQTSKKNEPQKM
jgi:hypothetical protein